MSEIGTGCVSRTVGFGDCHVGLEYISILRALQHCMFVRQNNVNKIQSDSRDNRLQNASLQVFKITLDHQLTAGNRTLCFSTLQSVR